MANEAVESKAMGERASSLKVADMDMERQGRRPIIEREARSSISGAVLPRTLRSDLSDRRRKIGHRRVNEAGLVTYKKKPTTELMAAIQLGIGQSITSLVGKPKRDLLLQDFSIVETVYFPRDGSSQTPTHTYSDFRFRTYAPVAFRYFRELFGIQPDDFLVSLCNYPLTELSNPGASGSIFYISEDDEFIIKTVQHKEADFLQKLLPGYYMNLNQNPRTLLPKFYGLYCYQCGNKNIRFVVMNNLLPSSIHMHEKYDLKGSTFKRKASRAEREKKSPTWKDLDFMELHPEGIMLEADTFNALIKTIERDCRVLQSFQIMDYSLLMSVHNLDQALREKHELKELEADSSPKQSTSGTVGEGSGDGNLKVTRGRSVHQRLAQYSTTMEAIHARSDPLEIDEEEIPPGGIPARNYRGERLLLYIGIIDILQSYRLAKKLEHAMKALLYDGDAISVHRPGFYSSRFQNFFGNSVFKKIPSLDQPQIKGPHVRFKKLVQIAMKHSPTSRKSAGSVTQKDNDTSRPVSDADIIGGAVGGRPDLLSNSTPPPADVTSIVVEKARDSVVLRSSAALSANLSASDGCASNNEMSLLASPAHTTTSTPTHTSFTEGTPSFTTSSPSCSSDVLAGRTPSHLSDTRSSTRHSTGGGDNTSEVMVVEVTSSGITSGSNVVVMATDSKSDQKPAV